MQSAFNVYVRRTLTKLPVCPIYEEWTFQRPQGMQLCVGMRRSARVIREPWPAPEAGSAPTIELQLDSTFHAPISSGLTTHNLVLSALESLKPGKTNSDRVSSNHLKFAIPVIAESVASFFTAILRHGYIPKSFHDRVVIPIPKSCNYLASSENYCPISLASCFSKVLECIIILMSIPPSFSAILYSLGLSVVLLHLFVLEL